MLLEMRSNLSSVGQLKVQLTASQLLLYESINELTFFVWKGKFAVPPAWSSRWLLFYSGGPFTTQRLRNNSRLYPNEIPLEHDTSLSRWFIRGGQEGARDRWRLVRWNRVKGALLMATAIFAPFREFRLVVRRNCRNYMRSKSFSNETW